MPLNIILQPPNTQGSNPISFEDIDLVPYHTLCSYNASSDLKKKRFIDNKWQVKYQLNILDAIVHPQILKQKI